MSYDLSIIIVNWNGSGLLTRCIETIASSAPNLTYEIVVVDNASQDDSIAQLRSNEVAAHLIAKGQLRIVNNADNRGFGAANNQAFALTDSPFVFLLNLDTEVRPGTIDTLVDRLRSEPTIGACGPKILNVDGSLQTSVFFNPPCVWHTVLSQLWLYRLLPQRIRGELLLGWHFKHDRERFVPMLCAAALMTRREMLDEVGGFNEKFHMYAEDNEWCWRITQSNWRLKFVPDAVVLHHGATSSSKRWSPTEQIRVKLRAEFEFEHQVMPRWRLAANQFANYMVATLQLTGRKLVGIQRPELQVIKEMHGEHLRRSLRNHLPKHG